MPRFVPDTLFSDCWSSVGNVTYYHRNGVCYFRSKAYSEFAGTAEQLEQKGLHQRAIKAWKGLSSKEQNRWRRYAEGVAAHRPPYGDGNSISGYNLFVSAYHGFAQLGKIQIEEPGVGRHPGRQRNYLSESVPDGASSEIKFVVPMNRNDLTMFQIHIRYLLLDTVTGYRSQYHGLSAIGSL